MKLHLHVCCMSQNILICILINTYNTCKKYVQCPVINTQNTQVHLHLVFNSQTNVQQHIGLFKRFHGEMLVCSTLEMCHSV